MLDEDSNALTSPPRTPPGMAALSSSSGSRRPRQRCRRRLRSASSSSPETRRSRRRYCSPAPRSGFSLPPQLSFPPWYWPTGILPPLSHCPRPLQRPTTSPTPPPPTVPMTLLRQEVAAAVQAALQTMGVPPPPPPTPPPPLPPPPPPPPPPLQHLPTGSAISTAPVAPAASAPQSGPSLGMLCRCTHLYTMLNCLTYIFQQF